MIAACRKPSLRETLFEAEKKLVADTVASKDSEKQSIIDLYRKKLIDASDLEQQLSKIASEKLALDMRNKLIEQETTLSVRHDTAEQLLADLQCRLGDTEPPYEVKREIVKSMVRKVVEKTEIPEDGRPQASVTVHYMFAKDVYTDTDSSLR